MKKARDDLDTSKCPNTENYLKYYKRIRRERERD